MIGPLRVSRLAGPALCALALAACGSSPARPAAPAGDTGRAAPDAAAQSLHVPIRSMTLPNGLRVVLSRDPTAPVVAVAVYYNIGFRIEPRDRTGFAHLFEHMMFQGSQN